LRHVLRQTWPLTCLVALGFALLQLVAGSQFIYEQDSYRYAKAAQLLLGSSPREAHLIALDAYCERISAQAEDAARLAPVRDHTPAETAATTARDCLTQWRDATDLSTEDPRFQAIFTTRPGYSILAAPFIAAFGVLPGMWLLGVLTSVGISLAVVGLLRAAGLGVAAVAGQVAFLASPLGYWSLQAMSEGLFTLCVVTAVWGGILLLRRRLPAGVAMTAAAFAVGAATRYSSMLVLAGCLAGAGAVAMLAERRLRHAGTAALAGVSALAAVAIITAMRVLDLPSAEITMQDTFTAHFARPEVADPWGALLGLGADLWAYWLAMQASMPYFLVLLGLGVYGLVRFGRGLGWLAAATAATGVATLSAHPVLSEASRLGMLLWVPVVLGLPLLVDRLLARLRPVAAEHRVEARSDQLLDAVG
jgi:hypothetical protein